MKIWLSTGTNESQSRDKLLSWKRWVTSKNPPDTHVISVTHIPQQPRGQIKFLSLLKWSRMQKTANGQQMNEKSWELAGLTWIKTVDWWRENNKILKSYHEIFSLWSEKAAKAKSIFSLNKTAYKPILFSIWNDIQVTFNQSHK